MEIIKTIAPLRISFAGGGTDIEPYISDYGSYILSVAIKMYCRAFCPCDDNFNSSIEKLLSSLSIKGKVKLVNDVQLESGLGGSASGFVAGLKAIYPQLDSRQLAKLAFYLERKVLKYAGGIQDQVCATEGGFLFMVFEGNDWNLEKLKVSDNFNKYLMLIYTGDRVVSGRDIIEDQSRCYNVKALHRQKQIARLMKEALLEDRFIDFGKLLDESWQHKKEQSALVSTSDIDDLYVKCLSLGAIGGVLAGAGSGGYMVLMENPDREGELRSNLIKNNINYFNVEFDTLGVRIIGDET